MQFKTQSSKRKRSGGFTLVELLTVIAVVSILMTAGAIGINNLAGGKGVSSAVGQTEAVFNLARQVAVSNNTTSRVLVAKSLGSGDSRHPDDLRRILVAYLDPATDKWQLSDRGEILPSGVFFSEEFSSVPGGSLRTAPRGDDMVSDFPAGSQGEYFYYQFNSEGISTDPGAGFVIGSGVWPPDQTQPRVSRKSERDFGGFVVWRSGRTSLYKSPSQIPGMPETVTNF